MRRTSILFFAFLMAVFTAVFPMVAWAAAPPEAGPGGTWIKGQVEAGGAYSLFLKSRQAAPSLFTIWAVKVYAEPSHTLLCVMMDESAPDSVLQAILAEKPRAMATGALDDSEVKFGIQAPRADDRTIRIEYVTQKAGEQNLFLLAELHGLNLDHFEMLSEPDAGGSIKHCGWCPPNFCGCVYCQGPAYTLCCPDCTIVCGVILCP